MTCAEFDAMMLTSPNDRTNGEVASFVRHALTCKSCSDKLDADRVALFEGMSPLEAMLFDAQSFIRAVAVVDRLLDDPEATAVASGK
jgi:hypothetical protein